MSIESTAIFDFLLKIFRNLSSLLRSLPYLSLLNSFLFLSRFSASLKSLDNYFFRWFAYKSLFSRYSVSISYNMCSSNYFSISSHFPCFSRSRFFRVQLFQGPGFSGTRFFRVQVFQGLGFSGSKFLRVQIFRVRAQGTCTGYRSSQAVLYSNTISVDYLDFVMILSNY